MKAALVPAVLALTALPALAQGNLTLGFYVDVSVGCANASNATLGLLHKTGLNSARTDCAFTGFTATGHNIYHYTERCTDITSGEAYDNEGDIELLAEDRFRLFGEGWEVTMAYCPQNALPDPWNSNDISDLLD
ncbi:hypothetical protein [Neotabrizicola sp. sgz301269]|uniref:hypothetical protein n=1 Tax=Neotabrizicola sp. sgz301269 TaxID=3276282 RepID=UPI0037701D91